MLPRPAPHEILMTTDEGPNNGTPDRSRDGDAPSPALPEQSKSTSGSPPFQAGRDLRTRLREHPSHRRWVLWTCLAGCFATTFTMTILGVSLRAIADDLGTDIATIAWVWRKYRQSVAQALAHSP